MEPRLFLRIEGLVALGLALGRCFSLGGPVRLLVALAGVGFWIGVDLAVLVAAIWAGHIGADGLKFESGFKETHRSIQPPPIAALTDSE